MKNSNCTKKKQFFDKLFKKSVTVGVNKKDNKKYPDSDVTTAQVGAIHEFGTSTMPARLWLRIFSLLNGEKDDLSDIIKLAIKENDNPVSAWEEIGAYQKDRVRDRILSNEVTPSSKNKTGITLVDTGQLVNSIDYEVRDV